MRPDKAIYLNKHRMCAGCGGTGDKLQIEFWKGFDFRYCAECAERRRKGVTPDWARAAVVSQERKKKYNVVDQFVED